MSVSSEISAYTPNLLKGKVFCAHCGGSLHRQRNIRKKSDDVYFYHYLSQSRISKDACPGATIREDALLDMSAEILQNALDAALPTLPWKWSSWRTVCGRWMPEPSSAVHWSRILRRSRLTVR